MKTLNTFDTIEQYNEARIQLNAYSEAVKEYCRINKTNGIPGEIAKTFPFADQVNNELRSKIETWEFINDKPEKYFIYIDEKEKVATTWTGDLLGHVYFGSEYRGNMGDKRQSIDIKAVNGLTYFGTYYKSSGDYARIKAKKQVATK